MKFGAHLQQQGLTMVLLGMLSMTATRTCSAFSARSSFTSGGALNKVRNYSSSKLTMKLQTAIVGLPNVGKSTLFNALTETQSAESANYPFCTIESNVGIVSVPDPKLLALSELNSKQNTYKKRKKKYSRHLLRLMLYQSLLWSLYCVSP